MILWLLFCFTSCEGKEAAGKETLATESTKSKGEKNNSLAGTYVETIVACGMPLNNTMCVVTETDHPMVYDFVFLSNDFKNYPTGVLSDPDYARGFRGNRDKPYKLVIDNSDPNLCTVVGWDSGSLTGTYSIKTDDSGTWWLDDYYQKVKEGETGIPRGIEELYYRLIPGTDDSYEMIHLFELGQYCQITFENWSPTSSIGEYYYYALSPDDTITKNGNTYTISDLGVYVKDMKGVSLTVTTSDETAVVDLKSGDDTGKGKELTGMYTRYIRKTPWPTE